MKANAHQSPQENLVLESKGNKNEALSVTFLS
jgi:hypothetical protein